MTGAAIIALFKSKPAITDVIGTGDVIRLYPGELPQDVTLPAIVYRMLPNVPNHSFSGPSKFDFRSVDFFCYSRQKDEAEELAGIIRDELEDESGTFAGININHILYMDDNDDFIPGTLTSGSLEYHAHRIELNFNWRR